MTRERSSKKPEVKPKVTLDYNTKTWKSYEEHGFQPPNNLDGEERYFLSKVDTTKGPIERTVSRIIRLKAIDYNSKKKERKEYLVYYEMWHARDLFGRKLVAGDHLEGMYYEQEEEPVINEGGDEVAYERSGQHPVYYTPFNKENVDKILSKSVGSDKENIIFMIKVSDTQRDNTFTYDQFVLPWEDILKLELRVGGPRNPAPITLTTKPGIG